MKTLLQIAYNIRFLYNPEAKVVAPEIEVVLTVSEPQYQFCGPDLGKVQITETLRFVVGPETARQLAAALMGAAKQATDEANVLNGKVKEDNDG